MRNEAVRRNIRRILLVYVFFGDKKICYEFRSASRVDCDEMKIFRGKKTLKEKYKKEGYNIKHEELRCLMEITKHFFGDCVHVDYLYYIIFY